MRSYPMLTPYQFASNTPIVAIDLDGLEAEPYQTGATSLVIINLGYVSPGPEEGKTQTKNGEQDQKDGLSSYFKNLGPNVQVVIFNPSIGQVTEDDIVKTINNFNEGVKKAKIKNSKVILVGHSLGADQLIEALDENKIKADLFISMDLSAGVLDDNETLSKNVCVDLVLGFYQTNDAPGGNILKSGKGNKSEIHNYEVNATHTTIDNKFGKAAALITKMFIGGRSKFDIFKVAGRQQKDWEELKKSKNTAGSGKNKTK